MFHVILIPIKNHLQFTQGTSGKCLGIAIEINPELVLDENGTMSRRLYMERKPRTLKPVCLYRAKSTLTEFLSRVMAVIA